MKKAVDQNKFSKYQIESDGIYTRIYFDNIDLTEANLFRRTIMRQIETYIIKYVIYYRNISHLKDEVLAKFFGQLIIDNDQYSNGDGHIIPFHFNEEREYKTSDIQGLNFRKDITFLTLKEGYDIKGRLIINRGTAKENVNFRPVSSVSIKKLDSRIMVRFINIGMLSDEEIVKRGIEKLNQELNDDRLNIYTGAVLDHQVK